jgi:hypothetical protein
VRKLIGFWSLVAFGVIVLIGILFPTFGNNPTILQNLLAWGVVIGLVSGMVWGLGAVDE